MAPDIAERIRQVRRNLAQIEELRTVIGRLLKEAESLLISIEGPDDPLGGSGGADRFKSR
jgi:uncharacterized spore protein YtfJ